MARHLECSIYDLKDDPGYQAIAGHLWAYQFTRIGWDDFAIKIDSTTREIMGKIFQDCRCNGFYDPHSIMRKGKKEIVFAQCVERDRKVELPECLEPDLCYLCEKHTCDSRDIKGHYKQDKKYCWRNKQPDRKDWE